MKYQKIIFKYTEKHIEHVQRCQVQNAACNVYKLLFHMSGCILSGDNTQQTLQCVLIRGPMSINHEQLNHSIAIIMDLTIALTYILKSPIAASKF